MNLAPEQNVEDTNLRLEEQQQQAPGETTLQEDGAVFLPCLRHPSWLKPKDSFLSNVTATRVLGFMLQVAFIHNPQPTSHHCLLSKVCLDLATPTWDQEAATRNGRDVISGGGS